MEMDDSLLLRRFAQTRCETAFTELVRRHLDFVYGTALRQVHGDHALARDVSQLVFCDLARKAPGMDPSVVLVGWLHTATRFAAAKAVRTAVRRRHREAKALAMTVSEGGSDCGETVWEELRPVIDDALGALKAAEKEVLILRFLEPHSIAEVATTLGIGESAARMRIERALERLRAQLARRKIVSTASALSVALGASQVVAAAPPALAGAVVATGLATAGTTATTGLSLLSFMTFSKIQWSVAAIALLGGSTWYVVQENERRELTKEIATLSEHPGRLGIQEKEIRNLRQTIADHKALRAQASELAALEARRDELWKRYQAKAALAASAPRAIKKQPDAPLSGPVFSLDELERVPQIVHKPRPEFPNDMRTAAIPGQATISAVVTKEGKVQDARVEYATGESFALAAIDAVEQWTFKPGIKDGEPVNTRLKIPMIFSVSNDSKEWF